MSKLFCIGSAVMALLCDVMMAREVTVVFSAKVTQVSGEPLSGAAEGMTATGVLRYETGTDNSSPVPQAGWYFQNRIRAFELRVGSIEVLGSESTEFRMENSSADTFRVVDGHPFDADRAMLLNGERLSSLRLQLAITDSTGAALDGIGLPENFPMSWPGGGDYPYSHTFQLTSGVSSLVMEFETLVEAGDPVVVPLVIESVEVGANGAIALGWSAVAGRAYAIERSGDLLEWERLPGVVWVTSGRGTWRGTGQPGYYRVVELGG